MKKKLLLIAPLFFGYYQEIVKEAEDMGYEVDYICDAPSNSNISKAIGRINKNLIKGATEKYFNQEVFPALEQRKYDKVLLVAGMTFAFLPNMVGKIRELNPKAKFVMYQWDSEKNLPYSTGIHSYFDEVYSFDRYDCMEKKMYHLLPLFYTRTYEEIGKMKREEQAYDCSYVGTAHPQKFKDINEMSMALQEAMPKQFIYHYMPSKLKYFYHKLTASEYRKAKLSEFQLEKVSTQKLMEIFSESKCVLDAPQAGQTGLTIRTIECLGEKKKLITTNADIKFYDFYDEANILVFDGKVNYDSPFFKEDYKELPIEIYQKYSLRNWLNIMLD